MIWIDITAWVYKPVSNAVGVKSNHQGYPIKDVRHQDVVRIVHFLRSVASSRYKLPVRCPYWQVQTTQSTRVWCKEIATRNFRFSLSRTKAAHFQCKHIRHVYQPLQQEKTIQSQRFLKRVNMYTEIVWWSERRYNLIYFWKIWLCVFN